MTEVTDEMKRQLQMNAQIPHLPTDLTYECRMAIAGEGPRAYDWSDKPHRLVYDLCRYIEAEAALSVPAQGAEPAAWITADAIESLQADGMCSLAAGRKQSSIYSVPIYLHPTPAHSGEREALERAARRLVNSELAEQIRKLVAGWNGDGIPEEYRMERHDNALGVTLPTNCGAIYMLDEVLSEFRAVLEAKP